MELPKICFKDSGIHGVGGFAETDISAGARVIEYLGRKISKQESIQQCELENAYVFCLDEETDLDGNVETESGAILESQLLSQL